MSSVRRASAARSCRSSLMRWRRFSVVWASACLFQKSGAAIRASRRLSSSSSRAASKIAPQVGGSFQQVGGTADQFVEDEGHGLLRDARRASTVRAMAACATRSPIVA